MTDKLAKGNGNSPRRRAPRNRTLVLTDGERQFYCQRLLRLAQAGTELDDIIDQTICQDLFEVLDLLPQRFVDLLVIDPPYNLSRNYGQTCFRKRSASQYAEWVEQWLPRLIETLKPTASVYICSEWSSSAVICNIAQKHLIVRNRITWERDKGRGASSNWKNCSEDIWYCTVSNNYTFHADAVKLKRRVVAPYTDAKREPKDWLATAEGKVRLTFPSNLWTDITVPFWSMPENTDHPTQKPEKLLAKIILASSSPNDIVLDPFLGSGTTSVVARKLGRRYVGIEIDEMYCCLAEKRLHLAAQDQRIQGYQDGVFWERNALSGTRGS